MHRIHVKLLLNSGQCPPTRRLVTGGPEMIKTSWCRQLPTLSADASACERLCVWKMIPHIKEATCQPEDDEETRSVRTGNRRHFRASQPRWVLVGVAQSLGACAGPLTSTAEVPLSKVLKPQMLR